MANLGGALAPPSPPLAPPLVRPLFQRWQRSYEKYVFGHLIEEGEGRDSDWVEDTSMW